MKIRGKGRSSQKSFRLLDDETIALKTELNIEIVRNLRKENLKNK